jgi:predicted ATPase
VSLLQSLELTRFKCFRAQRISLSAATALTGLNGMGKSSVIQALLLLRQSALAGLLRAPDGEGGQAGLLLNGDLVRLGTAADVLYEGAMEDTVLYKGVREDTIRIGIEATTGQPEWWRFRAPRTVDLLPWIDGPPLPPRLSLFGSHCYYLGAERVGPRPVHVLSASQVERNDLGADGSLAVAFLDAYGDQQVLAEVRHAASPSASLLPQVTAWMGEISPGVRLSTQAHIDLSLARLSFSFVTGGATSRSHRPTSVGFGLSYTLPVIVALLAAPAGSLVMIENPEAHLHPRGQVAMGEMVARAASAGVQVIVETHSDHVINGMRIAVREGRATPEQVGFHFFHRITETDREGDERPVHVVQSPRIDADGRLDAWPPGFFDQYDLALEKLL